MADKPKINTTDKDLLPPDKKKEDGKGDIVPKPVEPGEKTILHD